MSRDTRQLKLASKDWLKVLVFLKENESFTTDWCLFTTSKKGHGLGSSPFAEILDNTSNRVQAISRVKELYAKYPISEDTGVIEITQPKVGKVTRLRVMSIGDAVKYISKQLHL